MTTQPAMFFALIGDVDAPPLHVAVGSTPIYLDMGDALSAAERTRNAPGAKRLALALRELANDLDALAYRIEATNRALKEAKP
jgi:hypothetical protein